MSMAAMLLDSVAIGAGATTGAILRHQVRHHCDAGHDFMLVGRLFSSHTFVLQRRCRARLLHATCSHGPPSLWIQLAALHLGALSWVYRWVHGQNCSPLLAFVGWAACLFFSEWSLVIQVFFSIGLLIVTFLSGIHHFQYVRCGCHHACGAAEIRNGAQESLRYMLDAHADSNNISSLYSYQATMYVLANNIGSFGAAIAGAKVSESAATIWMREVSLSISFSTSD